MHEGLEPTGMQDSDNRPLYRLKEGWTLQALTVEPMHFKGAYGEWEIWVKPLTCAVVRSPNQPAEDHDTNQD